MKNEILALKNKYGDIVMRAALYQLLEVGIQAASRMDVKAELDKTSLEAGKSSIVEPEIQVQVGYCMKKLAKLKPDDIFGYIKTQLPIDGVTVHEGKNLCMRWDGTNDLILYCTVPGDTDPEKIEEAVRKMDEMAEEYFTAHGNSYVGFDNTDALWKACLAVGLRPKLTEVDRMIYV